MLWGHCWSVGLPVSLQQKKKCKLKYSQSIFLNYSLVLEDAIELIHFRCARKQWLSIVHLKDNAGRTPDIHSTVVALAQQHLGRPIPQSDNNWGEFHFGVVRLGQTEVRYFQVSLRWEEQILWLQITMDDTICMQEVHARQQLPRQSLQRENKPWKYLIFKISWVICYSTCMFVCDIPHAGRFSIISDKSCSRCSNTSRMSSFPSCSKNWHTSNSLRGWGNQTMC